MTKFLYKIAIDKAKRMFLLGAAAKALPETGRVAKGAASGVEDAISLRTSSGITDLARAYKGIRSLDGTLRNIARAKAYRTDRIQKGMPREKALLKAYVGKRVDDNTAGVRKYMKTERDARAAKKTLDTASKVLTPVKTLKEIRSSVSGKAKKLFSGVEDGI